ncbi:MAG: aminotransferase [Arcobacter sp.]|nr:MAG: aminotransferase [Arcobacter sp.]
MQEEKDLFRPFVTASTSFEEISKNIIGKNKDSYFDYTATGLAYAPIEERIQEILETYANTHSEFSGNAKKTSYYYDTARENLKKHLALDKEFVVLPCGTGATGAIKKFQELIGIYIPPATRKRFNIQCKEDETPLILVGPFEHHSNEISYREALCETIRIPLDASGNVDVKFLEKTLKNNSSRKIIGAFSTASNVTGIIPPYEKISVLLRKYNAIVAFDSAASSPCLNVDCKLFDAMFLSPHKLLGGPSTCGLLVIRKSLIDENSPPTFAGGGTVAYVSSKEHIFNSDIEIREDAGTPAILQLIKASFVYQLRNEIGIQRIQNKKIILFQTLKEALYKFDDCVIYGEHEKHDSVGILAINFKDVDPFLLCEKLSQDFGVQTRAGCSCAGPYGHDLFGIESTKSKEKSPSWLRISVNYTHNESALKHLISALASSTKILRNTLTYSKFSHYTKKT